MSIDEYIESYKAYKSGNYKFRHLRDENWIEKFIQKGRKVVFPKSSMIDNALIGAGIFSLILGLIFYITGIFNIGSDLILFTIIMWSVFGGVSVFLFIIPGLIMRKKIFFFILGPEGIVYKEQKSNNGEMIFWKDIVKIEVTEVKYRMKTAKFYSKIAELHLSNEKTIKMDRFVLEMKEFPKSPHEISDKQLNELFIYVIQKYYEIYKE